MHSAALELRSLLRILNTEHLQSTDQDFSEALKSLMAAPQCHREHKMCHQFQPLAKIESALVVFSAGNSYNLMHVCVYDGPDYL
jgi:hypothetical protein